jgi:hypothetical protein
MHKQIMGPKPLPDPPYGPALEAQETQFAIRGPNLATIHIFLSLTSVKATSPKKGYSENNFRFVFSCRYDFLVEDNDSKAGRSVLCMYA